MTPSVLWTEPSVAGEKRPVVSVFSTTEASLVKSRRRGTDWGNVGDIRTVRLAIANAVDSIILSAGQSTRSTTTPPQKVSHTSIRAIPGEPYSLRRPIPVSIERIGDEEFLARFEEANIGMTGDTAQEALQNLVVDLLDTLEAFQTEEATLGPDPASQLRILKSYLKKTP